MQNFKLKKKYLKIFESIYKIGKKTVIKLGDTEIQKHKF